MAGKNTKLVRSESNRIIGGICAGLGEFLGVDPTIIRLAFVLFTVLGGSGILIYIILWLIIPSEASGSTIDKENIKKNVEEMKASAGDLGKKFKSYSKGYNTRTVVGIILIGIGAVTLLDNLGIFKYFYLNKLIPGAILIILGILIFTRDRK